MIYLVCEKQPLKYSQDYCDALIKLLGWTYLLYDNPNEITFDPTCTYIFRLMVPDQFLKLPQQQLGKLWVLNTEQLNKVVWFDRIQSYARKGLRILTYDQYQSLTLPYLTTYLPYPILTDELERLSKLCQQPKIYDVVFCTANSPRRRALFTQLQGLGLKVVEACGWGQERDHVIGQAKLLVNIHYDPTYHIFEHIRCDRWILAGLLIVTEKSSSHNYQCLDLEDLMTTVDYDLMPAKIAELIRNYDHYQLQLNAKINQSGKAIRTQRQDICMKVNQLLT